MPTGKILKPFKSPFLTDFLLAPAALPFKDQEIILLDKELSAYEELFLNPEVERSLISRNEFLASFAISKAEASQLTLKEARFVYNLLLREPNYDFLARKLTIKKKLTQKDHDQLEFFNIARTFRAVNQNPFSPADLTPALLRDLHRQLTQGLDVFKDYLPEFTVYKSGAWRDNDDIRVGEYVSASHKDIDKGVKELLVYLKAQPTITAVAVFHTALYGLHPFNNGNKRVCRILEHVLLRGLGLNHKNLYSTSYYYHKQKPRYYKYLLFSLLRRNLNHFTAFALEALILSLISVLKTSLEIKRADYLRQQEFEGVNKSLFQPLIKRHEVQFKYLARYARGKAARQTLVNYLQEAVAKEVLLRRQEGRVTYYRLKFSAPEENTLKKWLALARSRLSFIPDEIRLI